MSITLKILVISISIPVGLSISQAGNKTDELQGTWTVKSIVVNGKQLAAKDLKDVKLVVNKDRYQVFQSSKKIAEGTFKIDPTKKPIHIDVNPVSNDKKKITTKLLAVYKLEKDELTVCGVREGAPRPTDFTSKKGSNRELIVYQRKK